MTWTKGQPWRVTRSLDRLNEQIRAAYPRAVPPATPAVAWGSIADSAHSTSSDHYPHYYSALGKTAVVCARDFPHAPALGLDAHALAEQLRLSRDPRISYVISNGRITGPNHGWAWDDYTGSDPHDTHIHVSSVHTAAADDTRDWQIQAGEDTVITDISDAAATKIARAVVNQQVGGPTSETVGRLLARIPVAFADDDPAVIAAAIVGLLPAGLAKQVAAELAARLAS